MKTDLLIDTCAAIWMTEDAPFSEEAAKEIDEAYRDGRCTFVSPMTAWERGMLDAKGRLSSPISPHRWFEILLTELGFVLAELTPGILIESSFLPGSVNSGPVDRIIIATARANDFTIITRDQKILDYADKGHVRAIAC